MHFIKDPNFEPKKLKKKNKQTKKCQNQQIFSNFNVQ